MEPPAVANAAPPRDGRRPPRRERHNLFFALQPDAATRTALAAAAARLAKLAPRGRWIKPERYHLTLRYLGEYAAEPLAAIAAARALADGLRARRFQLLIDRAGSFGGRCAPCWLGCSRAPDELVRLAADLETRLHGAGWAPARASFVPHLTFLRGAEAPLAAAIEPPVAWPVHDFVLVASRISPPAPHQVVGRWPLA
jgi:2'-5' RNA ligase